MPDEEIEPPTVTDLRERTRRLIESDTRGGYHPLRKHEKHRAYYCLTGEKLGDASNGEVSYRLIELLEDEYRLTDVRREDGRDPWDHGGPLTKSELTVLVEALEEEADDVDVEEADE